RGDVHHRHHQSYVAYKEAVQQEIATFIQDTLLEKKSAEDISLSGPINPKVALISHDPKMIQEIMTAFLYEESDLPWQSLRTLVSKMDQSEIRRFFDAITMPREHRRHKSPRALEHGFMTFEIIADFGVFRDLQRHRMLTQERQML